MNSIHFSDYLATQAKLDNYDKRIRKLEASKEKLYNSKKSSWINTLLHPLAKRIVEVKGFKNWEIMGPFGLGNETSLWFWNTEDERENYKVKSLTVRPYLEPEEENHFGFRVVNTNSDTGAYGKNTLGALNDFNKTTEFPPVDADVNWFISKLR